MKTFRFTFLIAMLLIVLQIAAAPLKKADSLVSKEIKVIRTELTKNQKDSILYEKLSADQLLELKKQEAEIEMQKIEASSRNNMPLNGPGIVLVVLIPFVFVILVLYIIGSLKNRESKRRYELYMKSLEMGQAIPEHFFEEPKKANPSSNLSKGTIALAVGIALIIYFTIVHNNAALIVGIVPAFVGLGYLLVHFLEKPKKELQE